MADRPGPDKIPDTAGKPNGALQLLTLFIVVLLAVPSRLVVGPLGGAGTPAELIGLGMAAWWLVMRLASRHVSTLRQPVRVAALVLGAAVLASYVAAATRPIDAGELRAADMGILSLLAWLGVLFVATDGPANRVELDTLLRRLTFGGGALASLGILQFVTGQAFTNYIKIPGLSTNNDLVSVISRNGLTRPAGTALHPIEFGAVLTTILPIALHYAMNDKHRGLIARWFPVGAIAVAVPISISRSAIISCVVVLCVLVPTWSPAARRWSVAALAAFSGVMYAASPGLIKTLTDLFSGISSDPSAQSRTGSYGLAWEFISRAPVFGRGFRTFLSSYRILDNQYLGMLIDTGFIGAAALLGLFVTGFVTSRKVRRVSSDPEARALAQALAASVAASTWSFAVFDAFSFPMATILIFLILGCVGCLRRVTQVPLEPARFPGDDDATVPLPRQRVST